MSVQNTGGKPRGRPRGFDPDDALDRAMAAFWDAGFAGTSLDALGIATGLNRPSLYLAFGDKRALYRAAIRRYAEGTLAALEKLLDRRPFRDALRHAYARAIAFYLAGDKAARGCFLIGTALAEAVGDPEVRDLVLSDLRDVDRVFEARLAAARDEGELPADAPAGLAALAAGVLHSFAVRARAGAPAAEMEAIAEAAVALICGPEPADAAAAPGA
jgi:TetR/AcrR family transcriptional regulator, copper-responsive repressor